jgi:hypothetical protein
VAHAILLILYYYQSTVNIITVAGSRLDGEVSDDGATI